MILLQLKTRELKNGKVNPKNYPIAEELKSLLKGEVVEITNPIPLKESIDLIKKADNIICIDSYLQHLCWYVGKQAIVLWGQSDPLIFGHDTNINLLKDRKYLRPNQHLIWEQAEANINSFVSPETVLQKM